MFKYCSRCTSYKSKDMFYKSKGEPDGLQKWCKECKSTHQKEVKKTYDKERYARMSEDAYKRMIYRTRGLSYEDYTKKLKYQNGVCAICHRECQTGKRLAVDHCHTTNKIRGLLCMKCNRALGLLEDNLMSVKRAVDYLEKYKNGPS